MTQVASSLRGHKLKASGHGAVQKREQADPLVCDWPEPAAFAPADEVPAPVLQPAGGAAGSSELLSAVWRTSSYLESMQWELDAAEASLLEAVRQAANSGLGHDELCRASNMTPKELAAALADVHASHLPALH